MKLVIWQSRIYRKYKYLVLHFGRCVLLHHFNMLHKCSFWCINKATLQKFSLNQVCLMTVGTFLSRTHLWIKTLLNLAIRSKTRHSFPTNTLSVAGLDAISVATSDCARIPRRPGDPSTWNGEVRWSRDLVWNWIIQSYYDFLLIKKMNLSVFQIIFFNNVKTNLATATKCICKSVKSSAFSSF